MFTSRNHSYTLNARLIWRVVRLTILGLLLAQLAPMAPLATQTGALTRHSEENSLVAAVLDTTVNGSADFVTGTSPSVVVKISRATPTAVTLSSFEASPPMFDLAAWFRQLPGLK